MHRGSSKGVGGPPAPETLPLSASPTFEVLFELAQAAPTAARRVQVARGTPLRAALRLAGLPPEGSVVLEAGRSLPLDTPIDAPRSLTVLSAFSGG